MASAHASTSISGQRPRGKRGGGGDMALPAAAAAVYNVSFSAFLMDEAPPDPHTRPQRNGRPLAPVGSSSAPVAVAAPPPHAHAISLRALKKQPVAQTPSAVSMSNRQDDIPVLEVVAADDDDVLLGPGSVMLGRDDDDGYDDALADELSDDVPVLQALEDAHRLGSKKFSWRESSRQVAKRKKSRAQELVPGPEALLRMSSATDFTSSSTGGSSGSLVSRNEALVFVDKQIVIQGYLFKQADILYVQVASRREGMEG